MSFPTSSGPTGDDKLSQRRRYFARRFAYELADHRPDPEYHVHVLTQDPFGNLATVTGTIMTLR